MQKIFYISFPILIVAIIAQQLFSLYYNRTYSKEEINHLFEPITSEYGIKIVYKIGDDFFSPLKNPHIPAGPPKGSKIRPIRHRVLLRYPDLLQKAFNRYPSKVIKNNLNAIYFARDIDDGDLKYGGTYDPFRRIIYLVDNGVKNDEKAMYAFHHEFSSLLLSRHSFFVNPWLDNNPKGFVYLTEKYNSWKAMEKDVEISKKGTEEDYEKGFIRAYGQTDLENDFNEYSAMIFTYPQKFKKIMNKYSRVRGKFKVWLEFYQKIDPIFTEEYLLGNSLNTAK